MRKDQTYTRPSFLSHFAPLVLRIVLGIVFIIHGYMKIANLEQTTNFFSTVNIPLPGVVAPVVALLEIIGGIALIIGLYSRIFALLLCVDMLFAIATAKAQASFVGGWEFELMLIAGLLSLALSGPGVISLTRRHKKSDAREPSVAVK